MNRPLPTEDLRFILERSEPAFREMKGTRIFISGGTGLLGKWLLSSLQAANQAWTLGIRATVLSRNPERFLADYPQFRDDSDLEWIRGDVRDFNLPSGAFDTLIHGATEASVSMNRERPSEMLQTQIDGTTRMVKLAKSSGAKRILFTSSGAVYGTIPSAVTHVSEDHPGAPDVLAEGAAYGEGKRVSEQILANAFREFGLEPKISRTFAVVGPYLPLELHFAIGNFIRDGLNGGPIRIAGDGTPTRSYLHMAEHTHWLWTLLSRGQPNRALNIGSAESYSISEVAEFCAKIFKTEVEISGTPKPGAPISRYVPDVTRAATELGLRQEIPLRNALERTVKWLKA